MPRVHSKTVPSKSMKYHLLDGDEGDIKSRCQKWGRLKVWVPILLAAAVIVGLLSMTTNNGVANSQLESHDSVTTSSSGDVPVIGYTNEEMFIRDKIRYKHTKRRLPDCIIIGIRKAGTRALLTFLDLHPQIQTASNEIHFFDEDENYEKGYEWYRKRMPYSFADQITLEKSPAYFSTIEVPQRVHKMNDSIKMLLIVRDPVSRSVSDYLQLYYNKLAKNKPTHTFEELAYDYEKNRVRTDYPPVERSLYYQYMWNWLRGFDLNQFLIVDGDEFTKDPLPALRLIEDFLGIEHRLNNHMFYFNKTRGFYCLRNETGDRCLAESKGRAHPDVDPKVISALRQYFAPYNQEFYKMVERDFGWPEK